MESPRRDGLLLVDKPAGMTSHDVVAVARRALGERRIGHAGTLDPFATGLLVLLVGSTTRLSVYLDGEPKVYEARVCFGAETDTDDLTGQTIRSAQLPVPAAVDAAIRSLTGELEQTPPAYSAKQVEGRRSYEAARRGQSLPLKPVVVTVHEWTIMNRQEDQIDVVISCSGGTYVRALARDLGRACGSAAHLGALRRLSSGPFHVADAVGIEEIREGGVRLREPLDGLRSLVVEPLDDGQVSRVSHGNPVTASVEGDRAALIDAQRRVVAIAERSGGEWRPKVVLRGA